MAPQPGIVLGLEHSPPPNISAQPGPKVLLGESVTIVCRGPSQATSFRVEKTHSGDGIKEKLKGCDSLDLNCGSLDRTPMNCGYEDQSNVSKDGSNKTEAQFRIRVLCEGSVGSYRCHYHYNDQWSVPSKLLDLVGTSKEDFDQNSGRREGVTPTSALSSQPLLCLSSTVLCTRSQQNSVSPSKIAADGPPLLGVTRSPITAAAEAPEEVTYTQLNPNSLSHAAPTQPEPGSEGCTYASVVKH